MGEERIARGLREHAAVIDQAFAGQAAALADFARQVVEVFHRGGRLLLIGNGPLGAVADLTAGLFLHRLILERPALPAFSLSHDGALASALALDGRGREYFARQLRAVATSGDVLLAMGCSQRDEALEEALALARQLGCRTAAIIQGKAELLEESCDTLFRFETESTSRAVEGALLLCHLLVELVEGELFGI
jgi:D-sedoheptulose 7-phosphate isomerase